MGPGDQIVAKVPPGGEGPRGHDRHQGSAGGDLGPGDQIVTKVLPGGDLGPGDKIVAKVLPGGDWGPYKASDFR